MKHYAKYKKKCCAEEFAGPVILRTKCNPFKVENLIYWYLLRNKYSICNIKDIVSLWKSYNDDFKTDNAIQEVEDFMAENPHLIEKRVIEQDTAFKTFSEEKNRVRQKYLKEECCGSKDNKGEMVEINKAIEKMEKHLKTTRSVFTQVDDEVH